jgi:NNP family nitrate/nitrite transporter-like MFS transporter
MKVASEHHEFKKEIGLLDATMMVAGSMIGEVGALGGGFVPNAMGLSKQFTGSYFLGFAAFAALAVAVLVMMRWMQIRWTRTWAEKGGRARGTAALSPAASTAGRATPPKPRRA